MLLNDLMKQLNESLDKAAGPKFTGYWKAKDAGTPGNKMIGNESVANEETNPTDIIKMDVPLFLRMMEYAKEDAQTDMDLHNVTERAIELMKSHEHMGMDNYDALVGKNAEMKEGWKDVAKVGAALGVAGGLGVAGKYADDHAQRVQIGNNQAYLITDPSAGTIPPTAKIVTGADGKQYKVWIKGGEPRTASTKRMFATPVKEDKIKGKDGKACWKGYRYAGTENGKDKCVKSGK